MTLCIRINEIDACKKPSNLLKYFVEKFIIRQQLQYLSVQIIKNNFKN